MPNFPQVQRDLTTVHIICVARPPSAGLDLHHKTWAPFSPHVPGALSMDVRGSRCSGVPVQHTVVICVITGPISKPFLFPTTNQCTEWGMTPPCTHTQNRAVLPPTLLCTEQTGPLPLGMKGNKGFSPGNGSGDPAQDCMDWRGLALLPEPAWPVQCNGRVTPDWVVSLAERGGADLALLHRALTTPNEDVI